MNLEYLLREGFIEINYWPKNLERFSRRIQVCLNSTPTKLVNTNLGQAIVHKTTGEMIILDMDIVEKYGTKQEIIENLDLNEAVQSLNR